MDPENDEKSQLLGLVRDYDPDSSRRKSRLGRHTPTYSSLLKDLQGSFVSDGDSEHERSMSDTDSLCSSKHAPTRLDSYDFTHPEWHPVDLLQNISSLRHQHLVLLDKKDRTPLYYTWLWLWRALQTPILLMLVAFITAIVGEALHSCIEMLHKIRWSLIGEAKNSSRSEWTPILVYFVITFCLVMFSSVITQWLCPVAAGGGVPEVKAVLQGSSNLAMSSFRLVWVKFVGVVCATGAGLSVGLEGPLIQIACTITGLLLRMKIFKYTRYNASENLKILGCACAAGVAATFGSAFGSTLFSIEITSTCYMVAGLPRAFLAAVVVVLVNSELGAGTRNALYHETTAEEWSVQPAFFDLALWVALGVLLGFCSILFVSCTTALSHWRNRVTRVALGEKLMRQRRVMVTLLFSCIAIPCGFLEMVYCMKVLNEESSPHALLDYMLEPGNTAEESKPVSWNHLIVPIFLIGATLGRLFGELLNILETWHGVEFMFDPRAFALVGAAAFSTAVIVYELSEETQLRVVMGIVLLIATFISSLFTKGVYESLMDAGGQPVLPPLPRKAYEIEVQEIMARCNYSSSKHKPLFFGARFGEAFDTLESYGDHRVIPVVKSYQDRVLVGSVLACDLETALMDYELRYEKQQQIFRPMTTMSEEVNEGVDRFVEGSDGEDSVQSSPRDRSFSGKQYVSFVKRLRSSFILKELPKPSIRESILSLKKIMFLVVFMSLLWNNIHIFFYSMRVHCSLSFIDLCQPQLNFLHVKSGGLIPSMSAYEKDIISGGKEETILILMDHSPFQIMHTTELRQVEYMFMMLKADVMFVCKSGQLVGCVTREMLRTFIGQTESKASDEYSGLCCCGRWAAFMHDQQLWWLGR